MPTRRTVLAAGVAAASLAWPVTGLANSDALYPLIHGWRRMLTGEGSPRDPRLQHILAAIDDEAARLQSLMILAGPRDALWSDLIGGHERRTTSSLQRLRLMSIAHQTPGSRHHASPTLGQAIIGALEWLSSERYFVGADKRGNWWDWEIGTPLRLLDVLVLMRSSLPEALVDRLLKAVEFYAPLPGHLHQYGTPSPATGANLAWISSVRAGGSLLRGDREGLKLARDTILPALEYTTSGDGFYRDGSFIQHHNIASTGAYGAAFSFLIADFATLLAGSPWALTATDLGPLLEWVDNGVLPLMHRGGCMDMVRSRSITRADVQDQETGLIFLLALSRMTELTDAAQAARLRRFIKHTVDTDTALSLFDIDIDAPGFQMTLDHAQIAARIVGDPATPSISPAPGHFQFASMDRVVHRRPAFTLGVAMYSSRVANYEAINGQNKRGWYTGHGMTYVYNGDLQHYRDGFWPTVDALRLPGVTSDGRPVAHQLLSPHAWVGGASLDQHGAVGMRVEFNDGPTRATKSWFCLGDRIVCLGSGIRGGNGSRVETTIENRRLSHGLRGEQLAVEGRPLPTTGGSHDIGEARWLHLPEVGGVLLGVDPAGPHEMTVHGMLEARSGDWQAVDELNPDATPFSRDYATVWIDHGVAPTDGFYAYVLLPGASEPETRDQARRTDLRILSADQDVHAVTDADLRILAANFWTEQGASAGSVTAQNPCSIMLQAGDGVLEVAVSDPTHLQAAVALSISVKGARVTAADDRVQIEIVGDAAYLRVNTSDAAGETIRLTLAVTEDPLPA